MKVIRKGDVMQCCGGFMIDDVDFQPYLGPREGTPDVCYTQVKKSSFQMFILQSIMGLPVALVLELLRQASK